LALPDIRVVVAAVLAVWFVLVLALGAEGAFVTPPGEVPFSIGLGATLPILAFFAAYWGSRHFRALVLSADLRVMAAVQAWRFAGFAFVALYLHDVLPGMFAWPAGLGDLAIGLTAPWVIFALMHRPHFAGGATFKVWNWLGILDLVIAVGVGALSSALATGVAGEITTGPMAELPLVLIPAYFVPIFIMLHLAALFQARRLPPPRH
jgi:hypothetical protein